MPDTVLGTWHIIVERKFRFLLWWSLHIKSNNHIDTCISNVIPNCYKKAKNRLVKDVKLKSWMTRKFLFARNQVGEVNPSNWGKIKGQKHQNVKKCWKGPMRKAWTISKFSPSFCSRVYDSVFAIRAARVSIWNVGFAILCADFKTYLTIFLIFHSQNVPMSKTLSHSKGIRKSYIPCPS